MPIKKLINRLSNWTSAKNQLSVPVSISDFDVYKEQEIPEEIARKIKEATSSVRMCFYKFHGHSDGGKKIIEAFKELAKKATDEQPIQVSILLNQRGGLAEQVYKPNEDSGLEDLVALQGQYPNFKINVHYHKAKALDTYHAKTVIIDPDTEAPYIFFCGGDIQRANDYERHQYETALMVRSKEMVQVAARDFDKLTIPSLTHNNNDSFASMMGALTRADLLTKQATAASHNAVYLSSKAHGNPLTELGLSPFKKILLESIQNAEKEIHILTANLNDSDIINELAQAANRGVKIKLVMGKHHNDSAEQFFGGTNLDNIQHLESLIDKQHKEFLRMHWVMNPETSELVLHGQAYTMHGKFCMVDRQLLLMGSSPLDKQAMQCSREIDTVVQIPTQQKADEVLSKLFNTPYAFGRDYYVDKVIGILTKEHQRLEKYSDPIAQDKTENLHQLLLQLSMPSISPQRAFELLKVARPSLEEKRNKWHSVEPKSLRALDKCIELCECSLSSADQEEYSEAVAIQKKASSVSVTTEQQSADPERVLTVHEELDQQIKPAIF